MHPFGTHGASKLMRLPKDTAAVSAFPPANGGSAIQRLPQAGEVTKTGSRVLAVLNPIKKLLRGGDVDCKEVRRSSSAYLEQDLPQAKHSAMQAHLSKCGPCRAFVDTLASTIGVLRRLPRVPAPPSLKQSLLDQTRHDGEKDA